VRAGEIYGLLGPNGAGKSTTAGMLTTRIVPTSGTAVVNGIDVAADPVSAKRSIGVVPQINTLDRSLTAWENLYCHATYFGMRSAAAKEAADRELERFRLTEKATASVAALSGGMAQRLMIARAVLHRPAVLFLDEPTAGLDPQSRLLVWELLRELHEAGHTIALMTHYMDEAESLCNRVAIIDQGRLLALGTPTELRRSVGAASEVAVSASDVHRLAEAIQSSLDGAWDVRIVNDSVRFRFEGRDGVFSDVSQVARRHRLDITDFGVAEPTLESVFVHLTGRDLRE